MSCKKLLNNFVFLKICKCNQLCFTIDMLDSKYHHFIIHKVRKENVTDSQYGDGWAYRCSTLPINIQHVQVQNIAISEIFSIALPTTGKVRQEDLLSIALHITK